MRVLELMEAWVRKAISEDHRDHRKAMTLVLSRAWVLSKKNAIKDGLR